MIVYHLNIEAMENRDMYLAIRAEGSKPEVVQAWNEGKYQKVAHVLPDPDRSVDDNLERAFELTNHIDADWRNNGGVDAEEGNHRSTSVGDIVVVQDTEVYLCAPMGWNKLEGCHV